MAAAMNMANLFFIVHADSVDYLSEIDLRSDSRQFFWIGSFGKWGDFEIFDYPWNPRKLAWWTIKSSYQ